MFLAPKSKGRERGRSIAFYLYKMSPSTHQTSFLNSQYYAILPLRLQVLACQERLPAIASLCNWLILPLYILPIKCIELLHFKTQNSTFCPWIYECNSQWNQLEMFWCQAELLSEGKFWVLNSKLLSYSKLPRDLMLQSNPIQLCFLLTPCFFEP